MEQNIQYLLIDHLDNNLSGNDLISVEALIRNDAATSREWNFLRAAVDAIQEAALYDQVSAVRKQFRENQTVSAKTQGAIVRTMYRNTMRVAASILLLIGVATLYKYTSVNAGSFYNKYYSSFELNTSRGTENSDAIEQAYRNKNWVEVVSAFDATKEKNNKSYFLNGIAELELKNYSKAIEAFSLVISNNEKNHDNYFQDEAEYYLAMSFLANNQSAKALPILEKIKADNQHLYNGKVKEMSSIDFMILEQKTK